MASVRRPWSAHLRIIMLSIKEDLMSEHHEHSPSPRHRAAGRRSGDESDAGGATQNAFRKSTRGAAKAGAPGGIQSTSGGDRGGDGSDSGGNTPPAGDPPSRGCD
jgi:hypothetical protein